MKKIFTILGVAGAMVFANAQNLVQNPGFEDWTDTTKPPTSWFGAASDFTRSTNPVKSGNYAAGITSRATATGGNVTVSAGATDIAVTTGKTYIFSGWYLDNVPNAAVRYWGQWRTATSLLDKETSLQINTNLAEGAEWKQFSVEAVAPETATIARLSLRVYNQNGQVGGTIFFDDIVFGDKSTLSVMDVKDFDRQVKMNTVVTDVLTLMLPEKSTVNIYSMDGKLMSSNRVSNNGTVSTSSLTTGTYLVTVDNGSSKISRKIIKK